jgi:hypothetical protein
MALFALLLPMLLSLGLIVISVGNWFVHARHLQTKADASALAGGGVWGFPCGPDLDARIETMARTFIGPHTAADGTVHGTGFNPQVGKVDADQLFVALNQASWWSGAFAAGDFSDPQGSVCQAKVLDVKVTEDDTPLLWGLLPLRPDIKRKARVEIQEVEGLTGLLPIAVRLPQPLSAAAAFYDETTRTILDVEPFRQVCTDAVPSCLFGVPPGLAQWTTEPALGSSGSWASFGVAATTGVVVATSFRPACGAGTPPAGPPCLDPTGWTGSSIDDFCRQSGGVVQCYDADGSGSTQTVGSGLHFIRGYGSTPTGTGPPQLRNVFLDNTPALSCGAYFSSVPSQCTVRLNVEIDLGELEGSYPPPLGNTGPLKASDVQVRYRLVRADGTSSCNYGVQCELLAANPDATGSDVRFWTTGTAASPHLPVPVGSRGNAVALEVRIRNAVNASDPDCNGTSNYNDSCRWYWTAGGGVFSESTPPTDAQILAAPVHRTFMGDLDRTGPVKWLRLTVDQDCDLGTLTDRIVGGDPVTGDDAASQPGGEQRCYVVDMGMSGGLARDQDEPPLALNLGSGSSQRALIDCDPDLPNLKDEIVTGCQTPSYAANKFDTSPLCPGTAGFFTVPKPAPFDTWPPFRCVLTQTTAAANQIVQGFNERIFGVSNNPVCPGDLAGEYVKGRNYWHRDNNAFDEPTFAWDANTAEPTDDWGNELRDDDPRLVTLFFTTYDSFVSPGNEVYAVVGFGNFYITGYGRTQNGGWQGGGPEDPCGSGNDGDLTNGNGNEPPPDLDFSRNTTWVWGHFVKDVQPNPFSTGTSGVLCNPEASFQPCVAVLVE